MLIEEPDVSRQQLLPLLDVLPGCDNLTQTADSVEGELLKQAKAGKLPDWGRWNKLIEQLDDEQYAKREAADRLLRKEGPAVMFSLEQLDYDQLDAEQQFRVRRIVAVLRRRIATDAPDQIAEMLLPDPLIWLALLDRPAKATRTAAANSLPRCSANRSTSIRPPIRRRNGSSGRSCERSLPRPPRRGERRSLAEGSGPAAPAGSQALRPGAIWKSFSSNHVGSIRSAGRTTPTTAAGRRWNS